MSTDEQVSDSRLVGPELEARELTVRFPGANGSELVIVESLDIVARPGELVCLSGRSGSGKTSVLRMLAGLSPMSGGRATWDGEDIGKLTPDERADLRRTRVAYLDQSAELVEDLSALENALLPVLPDGRRAVRAARKVAKERLKELGLGLRLAWRPRQLSGGERQRVALARALVSDAPGLLGDEPTASLDRSTADRVIALLRTHADSGRTILVASHDPAFLEAADRTITLES